MNTPAERIAELEALLLGVKNAFTKALPYLPADTLALHCGEWLGDIEEALETPHDRRPIWEFRVDGEFVRWCGTLEQFQKDCIDYVGCSQGTWEALGKHRRIYREGKDITRFSAVNQARATRPLDLNSKLKD